MRPLVLAVCLFPSIQCTSSSTPPAAASAEAATPSAFEQAMVSSLDPDTAACDDFYRYACGGWADAHPIPDDKSVIGRSFDAIQDANEALLREVLEQAAADPGDDPDLARLGAFYGACMDEEAIVARGRTPLVPMMESFADLSDRDAALVALHGLTVSPFLNVSVQADEQDPMVQVVQIGQRGTIIRNRDVYLEASRADMLEAYQVWLARMFVLEGDVEEEAQAHAGRVVAFEKQLAEVSWTRTQLRDPLATYNPHTMAELEALAPQLPWAALLAQIGLEGVDRVIVRTPSYFEAADDLIAAADEATLRAVYRAWVLSDVSEALGGAYDSTSFDFFGKVLRGQQAQRPRWKRCLSTTSSVLGESLGKAFVDRAFGGRSKEVADEMIDAIEAAFSVRIRELPWMDEPTRVAAEAKASGLRRKIGYPDTFQDMRALEVGPDHFENLLAGALFWREDNIRQLGQPTDLDEWFMPPQAVNAYYNPPYNEIVFPAGILQPPFFDAASPMAANFGAMGMVVGHELSHAFDDTGRRYAVSGALEDWWTPHAAEQFDERAACVEAAYDAVEVQSGEHIRGDLTLGENIADMGGVGLALRAYRSWAAEHGREAEIAGLNPEQVFFVSFAQAWCTNTRPELELNRLATDTHSPPRYRVNVPLQHSTAFADAFGCAEDAPMRAVDRCEVW